jgi:hypothetical protein
VWQCSSKVWISHIPILLHWQLFKYLTSTLDRGHSQRYVQSLQAELTFLTKIAAELPLLFGTHYEYRGNSTEYEWQVAEGMQSKFTSTFWPMLN